MLLSYDNLRYCIGMDASIIMLITSVDSQATAEALAHKMVKKRLAACVQISAPVTSTYHWKGNVESAKECCLSIKTTAERLNDAIAWLRRHHPYEVPELAWWPVHASDAYSAWARESVDECSA